MSVKWFISISRSYWKLLQLTVHVNSIFIKLPIKWEMRGSVCICGLFPRDCCFLLRTLLKYPAWLHGLNIWSSCRRCQWGLRKEKEYVVISMLNFLWNLDLCYSNHKRLIHSYYLTASLPQPVRLSGQFFSHESWGLGDIGRLESGLEPTPRT